MKRRTNPAATSRPRVPLSRSPLSERADIEGFMEIYQAKQMAPASMAADAEECLQEYLAARGLAFGPNGQEFQGCEVWELSRDGRRLATFSVERKAA